MLSTVQLDKQARLVTIKVKNVSSLPHDDWVLAPEFISAQTAVSHHGPQKRFGICLTNTQ